MIFDNKQLNLILNELLKNNKEARHYFVSFFKDLPESIIDIIRSRNSVHYEGENFEVNCFFSFKLIQVEVYYNSQYFFIEMNPITSEQISQIPFDQEHDIFLNKGYVNLDSPAYFNIIYNPDCDIYDTSIETPDIGYFIVKQKDGFHLISQSMNDAGIHNTKIDIEDFVIEPGDEYIEEAESEEEDLNHNQANKGRMPTKPHTRS